MFWFCFSFVRRSSVIKVLNDDPFSHQLLLFEWTFHECSHSLNWIDPNAIDGNLIELEPEIVQLESAMCRFWLWLRFCCVIQIEIEIDLEIRPCTYAMHPQAINWPINTHFNCHATKVNERTNKKIN